jgi:hypothetical protein
VKGFHFTDGTFYTIFAFPIKQSFPHEKFISAGYLFRFPFFAVAEAFCMLHPGRVPMESNRHAYFCFAAGCCSFLAFARFRRSKNNR